MLPRILIIMALVGVGLFLLKKAFGARKPPPSESQGKNGKLVACAHCAARLPATEALWKDGQAFCSMTHRNLGPRKGE
jgi:hypothetical protein